MNTIDFIHEGFVEPTPEAASLKEELLKRGVRVYTEVTKGAKSADLGIPEAKLDIEIDDIRHLTDPKQIVKDLARGYYESKDGNDVMHIPNEMLHAHLEEIADALAEASVIRKEKKLRVHLAK